LRDTPLNTVCRGVLMNIAAGGIYVACWAILCRNLEIQSLLRTITEKSGKISGKRTSNIESAGCLLRDIRGTF
jgi:hypothetical protein